MNELRSYIAKEPSSRGRFFCFSSGCEKGNVLLYVFLAVGLLAALSYAYVKDSRENYASQSSIQVAETLYSQANMIRAAVMECAEEYPSGGGDMNGDGIVDTNDNPNNPFPLAPSNALNLQAGRNNTTPIGPTGCTVTSNAAGCIPQESPANDYVSDLYCIGAPLGAAAMFSGASNQGRYLPPMPGNFTPWVYKNDLTFGGAGGVYIQTTSPGDAASAIALNRLTTSLYTSKQASVSGNVLTVWIVNNN